MRTTYATNPSFYTHEQHKKYLFTSVQQSSPVHAFVSPDFDTVTLHCLPDCAIMRQDSQSLFT